MNEIKTVLVTGGAGYVGSVLVPKLLKENYKVKVLDLYIYGNTLFPHTNLSEIKGDIRKKSDLKKALNSIDAVIHLACISNDPSYDLNPTLSKSINYDAFKPLIEEVKKAKIKRFIQASSSSVYGIKEEDNVTEDLLLEPLTDYAKYKALSEELLLKKLNPFVPTVIIRSATVCGYSPRQRLDLTVNILTNHAINNNVIKVLGGNQHRPNVHIDDITNLYKNLLTIPTAKMSGKVYNFGAQNHTVSEIAQMVKKIVRPKGGVVFEDTPDQRSYRISSGKIKKELGFAPKKSINQAITDLTKAFRKEKIPNSMTDERYYNIKTMQKINLV